MDKLSHLEAFFGARGGDRAFFIDEGGEKVDGQLLGKATFEGSGTRIDEGILSVDIALLTSLSMLSRGGGMLSIRARLFGEESLTKSTS